MAYSTLSGNIQWTDELLGRGGFGKVNVGSYEGKTVAVKIIQSDLLEKCDKEIELQKDLDHLNVLKLLTVEEDTERNGTRYKKRRIILGHPLFCIY